MMDRARAAFRFRVSLGVFVAGLVVSGVTAFPLLAEIRQLVSWLGLDQATSATGHHGLAFWILTVRFGLEEVYTRYPWVAYGTDWLAFGHIAIAFFFVGPLLRPAGSRSILYAGIAACSAVIPVAFICGSIRGIPVAWRLIDCSFGVFGVLPLLYCLRLLKRIESLAPPNEPDGFE